MKKASRSNLCFAGVGSRSTPERFLRTLEAISRYLTGKGYTCRHGGAMGADLAFSRGASRQEVYLASGADEAAVNLAKRLHPNWRAVERLPNSGYAQRLLGRNMQIVLGKNVEDPAPVDFLVCWTPGARAVGGSSHAINLCRMMGIPVYNVADPEQLQALRDFASAMAA